MYFERQYASSTVGSMSAAAPAGPATALCASRLACRRSPVGGIMAGLWAIRRSVNSAICTPRNFSVFGVLAQDPQLACRKLRRPCDQQAGEAADQRAVHADVLQV